MRPLQTAEGSLSCPGGLGSILLGIYKAGAAARSPAEFPSMFISLSLLLQVALFLVSVALSSPRVLVLLSVSPSLPEVLLVATYSQEVCAGILLGLSHHLTPGYTWVTDRPRMSGHRD